MKSAVRQIYDYKKADIIGLNNALSELTFDISESDDIDKVWSSWKNSFLAVVKEHVPTKTVNDTYSLPWID